MLAGPYVHMKELKEGKFFQGLSCIKLAFEKFLGIFLYVSGCLCRLSLCSLRDRVMKLERDNFHRIKCH